MTSTAIPFRRPALLTRQASTSGTRSPALLCQR